MARLIRMDRTGHTTLAEWTAGDEAAVEEAVRSLREQLDEGYYAVVSEGEGRARQVTELPVDAGAGHPPPADRGWVTSSRAERQRRAAGRDQSPERQRRAAGWVTSSRA